MGADAPTSDLDLWSRDVLIEPWEHFRTLRDTAPAVYLERYEVFAVGRYRDVRGCCGTGRRSPPPTASPSTT